MNTYNQAVANLKDFHSVAGDIGLRFCLMDGTLLGAVRDGDFCPGDEDDIDVGVLDRHYDKTELLVEKMKPLGFERYKSFILKGKVEGFGLRRGASHFDVIRINKHPHRSECYNFGRTTGGKKILAFVYPSLHHDSFGLINFHEKMFMTPYDPEGFLTCRYGDWKTPINRPSFIWWEDANKESIRYDYDML